MALLSRKTVWALITLWAGGGAAGMCATLTITHAAVQKFEDGPPVYRDEEFVPGETVNFSFLVEGYSRKDGKINVKFEAEPKDPAGVALTKPISGANTSSLAAEDKDWAPKFRGKVALPVILPGGAYHIRVHVTDEQGDTSADRDLEFTVQGPALHANTALAIESLNFFRNEDDAQALAVAAYRPGEGMHARFAITGFKHKDDGAIDVTYGLSLVGSEGQVLFEQADAAHDDSAEFYPKPYVPGVIDFSLKPGTPSGTFSLKVTARDAVGGQTAEASRKFRLE